MNLCSIRERWKRTKRRRIDHERVSFFHKGQPSLLRNTSKAAPTIKNRKIDHFVYGLNFDFNVSHCDILPFFVSFCEIKILPKRFCDAAGLNERKKVVKVEYQDEDGNRRSEMVSTDLRPKKSTDLTKGWPRFREANGFIYGKNYSFEFIPGQNVIRVREVAASSSSSSNEAGGTEDQIPSFMMFGLWKSSSTLVMTI